MYERSAIVLENYFDKILGLNKENNLKNNYENYSRLIQEIKEYQKMIEEEESVIGKFDESASEIQSLQNKQKKLYEQNIKIEQERNELFNDLSENTSTLDQRLQKIEKILDANNENMKNLREEYVKTLIIFTERQRERNKYARTHRTKEANYLNVVKLSNANFENFNVKQIQSVKKYIENYKNNIEEVTELMLKNGRNERVPFSEEAIRNAVEERSKIAKEEAELYISIFERMKRLLQEVNSGTVKLAKSEKLLRDVSVKLSILRAKKEYIIVFLDNERMTAMNGKKVHNTLMEEACKNFVLDMAQIDKLYELVKKETAGKATKKAYKELYNKNYLKDIEEKEKDFEEEAINIKINVGALVNFNYWRIEGIKNVYNTFQEEVSEKFEKDLSEYRIDEEEKEIEKVEEVEEVETEEQEELPKALSKINNKKIDEEFEEQYDEDDNYDEDEYEEDDDYQDVVFDEEEEESENKYNKNDNDEIDEYEEDNEYYEDKDEYYYDDEEDDSDEIEDIILDNDEEDDDITEEKIEQLIKNSRKGNKRKETKIEKGLFGKLFKK